MSQASRFAGKLRSVIRNLPWRIAYHPGPTGMPVGLMVASRLRKWWVIYRHPFATIRFEEPVYLGPGFSLNIPGAGTFIAGRGTDFRRNFRAEIVGTGRIVIGADVAFTHEAVIQCSTSVEIGDRAIFGPFVSIVDGNHRYRDLGTPIMGQGSDFRTVRVEDDVWAGAKATIVGANIGHRAVIGAGAVVTKDVPPYTVVGGVPARALSYYGPPPGMESPDRSAG
jgi:acetyltransferase-like isoleucine patch superfamily enzyme